MKKAELIRRQEVTEMTAQRNELTAQEKEIILNIIARKRIERRRKAKQAKERKEAIEAALIWPMAFFGMASWYLIIYAFGG